MSISRRRFIRNMGMGLASTGLAAKQLAALTEITGDSEKLLIDRPGQPEPAPDGYDRLPLGWYKNTVQRLKEKVSAKGIDAILLESDHNKVYFSGCFRGSGERTTWLLFPVEEKDTAYWYSPGIDRDLITSWLCTENE